MGTLRIDRGKGKKEKGSAGLADKKIEQDAADEFEIIVDKRHRYTGSEDLVSCNSKLGRIVLYSQTWERTIKRYGKEFAFVQLLTKPSKPGYFWIRPCEREATGSRSVHLAAGSRMISAKLLLQKLGWESDVAVHFESTWDEGAKALMVNIREPKK